ncbi:MAG: alpha-1,2-fucosyltransferase [Eubacteriales bacterium]
MIIIQLSGGLGNQMFQYALYRQMKAMGKDVKIDISSKYGKSDNRPIQLSFLHTKYEVASEKEILDMTDAHMDIISKVKRKVVGRKRLGYMEQDHLYDSKVWRLDHSYIEGCWQSEKYFADVESEEKKAPNIKDILQKELQVKEEFLSESCKAYEKEIQKSQAVSMHIRRGDYLASDVVSLYGNICTQEYYENAMEKIKEQVENPHFFIFTNDIPWASATYQGEEFTIVDCSDEDTGYQDLYLMSLCQHNIIANSSFSWWGSWLNKNPEKIVIAPNTWLNGRDCRDIYYAGMLVI